MTLEVAQRLAVPSIKVPGLNYSNMANNKYNYTKQLLGSDSRISVLLLKAKSSHVHEIIN